MFQKAICFLNLLDYCKKNLINFFINLCLRKYSLFFLKEEDLYPKVIKVF